MDMKARWDAFARATNQRDHATLLATMSRLERVSSPRATSPRLQPLSPRGALAHPAPRGSPRNRHPPPLAFGPHAHLAHPEYHPPSFHTDPPTVRRPRPFVLPAQAHKPRPKTVLNEDAKLAAAGVHMAGVSAKEVQEATRMIRQHWETKYGTINHGFLVLDCDHDGHISHEEFEMLNKMFNLEIRRPVMDAIYALADCKHQGFIDYAEFQRMLTSEDALHMRMDRLYAVEKAKVDRTGRGYSHDQTGNELQQWERMAHHTVAKEGHEEADPEPLAW